jgi:hypothetical protein
VASVGSDVAIWANSPAPSLPELRTTVHLRLLHPAAASSLVVL